jgi:chaperone modulatory protein CbpM
VSEEELHEVVGLGVIEPYEDETFDDHALTVMRRAVRLRQELELDWPGIAVALTLLEENAQLRQENRLLRQRLSVLSAILSASGPAWCWPFIVRPALLMTLSSR